jgi:hypothetical protein
MKIDITGQWGKNHKNLMKYYSATKKNELMSFAVKWTELTHHVE